MKLLHQKFDKGGEGHIKCIPEEPEDMWHAYNLIRAGDQVTATTFRKVTKEAGVGMDSDRVKLKLTLAVEGVDFDPEGCVIRISGRNMTESDHIKLSAYHSLELEPHRAFVLQKTEWDVLDIERLRQACNPALSADLAAVLITEGLATLCLVGSSLTLVRAKVEANLPGKRGAAGAGYDKAYAKFMNNVFDAVVRHVNFDVVKCLVVAGPGFAKDQFKTYLETEAVRREVRPLIEHRDCVVVASVSSAYKHSLKELMSAPAIASRIKDTKAARETQALQEFYDMLARDPARAFYGPGHVAAAADLGAIGTLLLSDSLFRVNDVAKRRRYAALVDGVVAGGGEALIFSSLHVSGEQLNQLSGIAAVLRFPLPHLEDQEIAGEL